jgi:hypothetical protein
MPKSSALIIKNIKQQDAPKYLFTSMVSHRGTPVSFAMTTDGDILYSVLDMSNTEQNTSQDGNDKDYWSKVNHSGGQERANRLVFPMEIIQVGYGVVPNFPIDRYDSSNNKIIHSYDSDGKPLGKNKEELYEKDIDKKTDPFNSSTARLGAKAPFQVLSDAKYIYLFRQSIAGNDPNNEKTDSSREDSGIVNNTLLVDRFILSGTMLKRSREIRYQRSRHKTEPESRKDTLSAVDMEGKPFYEPTRELAFANNLSNGNFAVLLIPGADTEEKRWQIFTIDDVNGTVNSFNIKFDYSIVFDTSDSQSVVTEFLQRHGLDANLISDLQTKIGEGTGDLAITSELSKEKTFNYENLDQSAKNVLRDDLSEFVFAVRTGVMKDDFVLESTSEWPLIEYEEGSKDIIKSEYLGSDGKPKKEYAFQGSSKELKPRSSPYTPKNGLSACYYYQQEMGPDGKPIKNKACVMLAMGLEDKSNNRYLGILNFAVSASGRLSRLTTDAVNLPDINVQALDENPYRTLEEIQNRVAWQQPKKMRLLDIDPNGLSTSGGVLKFAYTSSAISESQGYSAAAEATDPFLFDDSLGRVNLYFKGKNNDFFVLYFNPTGSKSVTAEPVAPPLVLKPRLDRDMTINVSASLPDDGDSNTCTLSMTSLDKEVEQWAYLPKRYSQIASILNGNSELPLGTLEPLGDALDLRVAYIKSSKAKGTLKLRTTVYNNLMFQVQNAFATQIADGKTHSLALSKLSTYLAKNPKLRLANKSFALVGKVKLKADIFYKSYLSGMLDDTDDIDKLWGYLTKALIKKVPKVTDRGYLSSAAMTGDANALSTVLADSDIKNLSLQLLQGGNAADIKARLTRLKQSLITLILDVANVRIASFEVEDINTQSVERLEAGLAVGVVYDYDTHFSCTPANLDGTSASEWEHARSYLFNAGIKDDDNTNPAMEIGADFDHQYFINNTIGQWEDWEASLALEFNPKSAKNGAVLTADSSKLEALQPSEKGLSVEVWVKPAEDNKLNNPGTILHYKKGNRHYSLGIEKDGTDKYKCIACLGDKKYTSKAISFGKDQWRHLAFTHKKYWGYQLGSKNTINCGNDSSLQLADEFTLEVLVKIDKEGTILEKKGEYKLSINKKKEIVFDWAGENYLAVGDSKPEPLDEFKQFYKITLIRSRKQPQTGPSKAQYPITGGDKGGCNSSEKKWYEDKKGDALTMGLAEKQDQMACQMEQSQNSMLGNFADPAAEYNLAYYHTLIVTKADNSSKEWTSPAPQEVESVEAYQAFMIGGGAFEGTFASVRIWNRVLSTPEAKVLSLPDNKTGLLSYWRMAEGKGNYLYDEVSENHGIVDGGSWTDSPRSDEAGQFQFYVDGSPEAHDTPTIITAQEVDQLSIGGIKIKEASFKDCFNGTLEEIRIWNVPRTNEQITDNAFGRLKGEWEALLANYTFDKPINPETKKVLDASVNSAHLIIENDSEDKENSMLKEVLSTAPIATEIPQVRSALTGVLTDYNGTIKSRPGVVEYGDVQKNDDGTLNGILKRCYSFIDEGGIWNRMTGYKVGNLISQWFGQAQFAPQVMGYLEGTPPVPAENFPLGSDSDVRTYAYSLNNSISFNQAEEVTYNYSTSKESGWNVAVESEMKAGVSTRMLIAPLGFGLSVGVKAGMATESNWESSGQRSQSFERGNSVNTERALSAAMAGYDNGESGEKRFYKLGNTGYALVKSKTADIYLLRLAHNNALVSISWQPNPDIPEDVNIIPFPINPLYTKQGTLDGKFGETTDDHYPQAQGAYGQYSYFKPREAYKLKKQIEREKMELEAYFKDSFDVAKTNAHFQAATAATGVAQLAAFYPVAGPVISSAFNQVAGQLATQVGYNNSELKNDLAKMGSQRSLVNTYVWTVEGGFYAESTEVAETQQETYANETSLALGGKAGVMYEMEAGAGFEQKSLFSSGSSFTLTKSKTKESSTSFGLDVNVDVPTSPRYKYAGTDGRSLTNKGLIKPGTVDAYRFMSFYLEPKGENFKDLFSKVIDPIWLDENPDPNAQALRQARGDIDKAKPCWRIMHRVTYVSRILPEFQPEVPPSLEKSLRVAGIESNYMLIKKFEPYLAKLSDSATFFDKIEEIIKDQLPEFIMYKHQIKKYLALYFNIDQV